MKRNVLIATGATIAVTLASAMIFIIKKAADYKRY